VIHTTNFMKLRLNASQNKLVKTSFFVLLATTSYLVLSLMVSKLFFTLIG